MDNLQFERVVIRALYSLARAIAVTNDTSLRLLEPTLRELATLYPAVVGPEQAHRWCCAKAKRDGVF